MKNTIKKLIDLSPRQGANAKKTADFIIAYLKQNNIKTTAENFPLEIPIIKKAVLLGDGKSISCAGCSFVGGAIENKDYILSSLIPSRYFLDKPNINFNPKSNFISLSNFYFAPAVAVKSSDLKKITKAKKVKGEVIVEKFKGKIPNITVGNKKNPKTIIFSHYDSIGPGAIDNASGVAVCLEVIVKFPQVLKDNLFVFDGNEELSYDYPTYWGKGFRIFEKKYLSIMEKSKKILILDCLGNGKTQKTNNLNVLKLAFPIKNIKKWQKKTFTLFGDIEKLMGVYHSSGDNDSQLEEKCLKESVRALIKELA